MPKKTKTHVLAMTVADFNLPAVSRNNLIRAYLHSKHAQFALPKQDPGQHSGYYAERRRERKEFEELSRQITIGHLIAAKTVHPGQPKDPFTRQLLALGLTRIDWVQLPASTITPEVLKRVSRDDLLKMPLKLFGLTPEALNRVTRGEVHENLEPTIEEFLSWTWEEYRLCMFVSLKKSAIRLHRQLTRVGFTEKDGIFMEYMKDKSQTPRERLATEHGISGKDAERILTIAVAERWIPRKSLSE